MCFGPLFGGGSRRRSESDAAARGATRRASAPAASASVPAPRRGSASSFAAIPDTFETLGEVQGALRSRGLAACSLVVAVDFTKSNEWTGKASFRGQCLHALVPPPEQNPYQRVLGVIARTLAPFDDDGLIPCFGFGDATTGDAAVFSFFPDGAPARGANAMLSRYSELAPAVTLAGPTSFGPAIRAATACALRAGNEFTLLLLVADGQVTRSSDTPPGRLSLQEADTVAALVAASQCAALAVIMVGVGDGPWDMMRAFDDALPQRRFDNWQFVQVQALRSPPGTAAWEAEFALACLQEVPEQFNTVKRLKLLGSRPGTLPPATRVLPPPLALPPPVALAAEAPPPRSRRVSAPAVPAPERRAATQADTDAQGQAASCAVCLDRPRNAVLVPCGHAALCVDCAASVMAASRRCPICRARAESHVRLFL